MKIRYILDTGTQLFAECETKEDTLIMGSELLLNENDHGYLDIYFTNNDDIEPIAHLGELSFIDRDWNLYDTWEEWEKVWVKKMWELNFTSKKELKQLLYM